MTNDNDRDDDGVQYHDSWPEEHDDSRTGDTPEDDRSGASQRPAQSSGMSTGMKVLLVVCCLGGVGMLACCGVCAVLGYSFQPKLVSTATEVEQIKREIADFEVPPEFEPDNAFVMDNFFFSMKAASYKLKQGNGQLAVMSMQVKFADAQPGEVELRENLQLHGNRGKQIDIDESETKELKIGGQTVEFTFAKGKDRTTGKAFREVSGLLPSNQQFRLLILQVEEEAYHEEAVIKMIESIP